MGHKTDGLTIARLLLSAGARGDRRTLADAIDSFGEDESIALELLK